MKRAGQYAIALVIAILAIGLVGYTVIRGSVGLVASFGPVAGVNAESIHFDAGLLVVTTLYLMATAVIAWSGIRGIQQARESERRAADSAEVARAALAQMGVQAQAAQQSAEAARISLDQMRAQSEAARESAEAAKAALGLLQVQGEAARDAAEAARASLEEMRAQGRRAARPVIVFLHDERPAGSGRTPWDFTLQVRNVGQGPAMNIQVTIEHEEDRSLLSRYGWGMVSSLTTGEQSRVWLSLARDESGPVAVPAEPRRVWTTARAEYMDVEGQVHLTKCRVLLGPHGFLPDRRTRSEGGFPVSIEPGTHAFGSAEHLSEMH